MTSTACSTTTAYAANSSRRAARTARTSATRGPDLRTLGRQRRIPHGPKGDDIVLAAGVVNLCRRPRGLPGAGGRRRRSRSRATQRHPVRPCARDLVAAAAPALFEDLDVAASWDAVIDAEPGPAPPLTARTTLDTALEAIADFVDIDPVHPRPPAGSPNWPPPRRDGTGVAPLVTHVRRAGLLHDLERPVSPTGVGQDRAVKRGGTRADPAAPVPDRADARVVRWPGRVRRDRHPAPRAARRFRLPVRGRGDVLSMAGRLLAAADAIRHEDRATTAPTRAHPGRRGGVAALGSRHGAT